MKKTIFISTVLAALVCICASCQKGLEEVQEGGLTVTATIAGGGNGSADGTKVLAEDTGTALKLKWEVGDIVFGFDNANNTYNFKVTAVAGGKATLKRIAAGSEKGTATSDPDNNTKMYLFYAPGMKASDLDVDTPASLFTYDISTQTKDVVPVLMTSTGTVQNGALALDFQVRTALIGIKTPTMVNDATTSIILSSTAALNTKVTFSLDGSGNIEATYGSSSAGTITKAVNFTEKNPATNTFIVVCPVSSADLTFASNNGEIITKTAKTLEAGKYYFMTPEFFIPREIEVSFLEATSSIFIQEDGTTATPNGFKFVGGETIKVANGQHDPEDCTVTVDGTGKATITTLLPGELTAIFPASAAVVSGKEISLPATIDDTAPAEQDGTLASAMLATATIGEDVITGAVSFENQRTATSIFRIDIPAGAKKLTVRSLKAVKLETRYSTNILEPISRSEDAKAINSADGTEITVTPASGPLTGPCFIRLKPGVKFSDLAFDVEMTESKTVTADAPVANVSGSMKGIPERYIKGFNSKTNVRDNNFDTNNTTEAGKVYTIGLDNWHYYVKIGNYKWATMNIGATALTGIDSYGYYFAWAEVRGHKLDPDKSYSTTGSTTFYAFQKDFNSFETNGYNADKRYFYPEGGTSTRWSSGNEFDNYGYNTPYNNGGSDKWWKYCSSDSRTALELMDDAAYYNWGGPWEVPGGMDTDSPYKQLVSSATYVTKPSGAAEFENSLGWTLTRVADPRITLFFPAAGYGYNGNTFGSAGTNLYNWCKDHGTSHNYSYSLSVSESNCTISYTNQIKESDKYRANGCTIRPVSAY